MSKSHEGTREERPEAEGHLPNDVVDTRNHNGATYFRLRDGRVLMMGPAGLPPIEVQPALMPRQELQSAATAGRQEPSKSFFGMRSPQATGTWPGDGIGNGTPTPLPEGTRLGGYAASGDGDQSDK